MYCHSKKYINEEQRDYVAQLLQNITNLNQQLESAKLTLSATIQAYTLGEAAGDVSINQDEDGTYIGYSKEIPDIPDEE